MKSINNIPLLKKFRKKLRNQSTSAEATLWLSLKNKQIAGKKFRRQHSIGKYILDFYCASAKLAVELDGEDHFWEEGMEKDERRNAFLQEMGIEVIRFENKWVFEDLEFVLDEIEKRLERDAK